MLSVFEGAIPFLKCVESLIPIAFPAVCLSSETNYIATDIENNYSNFFSSSGKLITVDNKLYGITSFGDNIYKLYEIDTTNNTLGAPISIPDVLNTNCSLVVVGTKIYFYGGQPRTNYIVNNNFYVYDISNGVTTTLTSGGIARRDASGYYLNDKLYFHGGFNSSGVKQSAFSEYDINTPTWTERPTDPVARSGATMIHLGTDIYLTGAFLGNISVEAEGRKIWKYATTTNTWADTAEVIPTDASISSTFSIIDGVIYFCNTSSDARNLYSYTPGSGFTKVYDVATTTEENLSGYDLLEFKKLLPFNNEIYFASSISRATINGNPTTYLIGTVNLATTKIIGKAYPVANIKILVNTIPIKTTQEDTPSKIKFEFSNTTNLAVPLIMEQDYDLNKETSNGIDIYTLDYPSSSDPIAQIRIAQKSTNSVYSDWSSYINLTQGD